jgi:drug/metabolite transporter (DMT)-like permease
VRLSDTTPETVALFRCLFALPFLGLITILENKRYGGLPRRATMLGWVAGVFFATDLIFWHHSIEAVGAGLATVLGNLQVLIVGFAAWWILGEKPHRALVAAIPIVVIGVVFVSGAIGEDAYGADPTLGVVYGIATSIAYAAFLLVLRHGSGDLRRVAGPLFHATLASAAAVIAYGVVFGGLTNPGAESLLWLLCLAISSQVIGWLLISRSLPRLPAAITSVVLLLQPVGSMLLAAVILREDPAPAQIAGAAMILAGVVVATSRQRRERTVPDPALPSTMQMESQAPSTRST